MTKTVTNKVELQNVLCAEGTRNITVEVVPFNRRNNDHVEFAFAVADMVGRMPSPFATMSDAAKRYVELFMVHKEEDANNADSDFSCVYNDLRACRILYNTPEFQKQLADFFELA